MDSGYLAASIGNAYLHVPPFSVNGREEQGIVELVGGAPKGVR